MCERSRYTRAETITRVQAPHREQSDLRDSSAQLPISLHHARSHPSLRRVAFGAVVWLRVESSTAPIREARTRAGDRTVRRARPPLLVDTSWNHPGPTVH